MQYIITIFLLSFFSLHAGIVLPQNFTSHFMQKVTSPKGKVVLYKGSVYFDHSNRLKWVYTYPTEKEVCSSGNSFVVVDHDLEQVTSYKLFRTIDMIEIFQEAKPYKQSIFTTEIHDTLYTIQLNKQKQLHSLAYFDDMENKVQIVFENMQYNSKNFTSKVLECIEPPSYDKL
jgi:outer membrane lipoprotein carrier protein